MDNKYKLEDLSQELSEQLINIPGMEEFMELLATPDKIFDVMYPELKKVVKEQINSPDIKKFLEDAKNQEGYKEAIKGMPEILDSLSQIKGINKNKLEFLDILFSMFLDHSDIEIAVQLLPGAVIPHYVHDTDAGMDIYANEDILIPAHAYGVLVKTGLKCAIPEGWQLAIRPRSGMSKKTPIRLSNCVGTIDSGYRDEIGVLVDNISDIDYTINNGDRIAQFIVEKVYKGKWDIVEDVSTIGENRGGGFGSSGD